MDEKIKSRKFLVWIVWVVLILGALVICGVVLAIQKELPESLIGSLDSIISYFFFISLAYLGFNFGQKIGLAFAGNKLKIETEDEEKEEEKEEK